MTINKLTFNQPSFEDVSKKEFLATNGIGGYSSSSLCHLNTRKYHGVLIAAQNPPTDRLVLVSKLEEVIDGINISTSQFPNSVFPKGFEHLISFEANPFPKSTFTVNKAVISKTVFMPHGENSTLVEYKNEGSNTVQIQVRPHFVNRDIHQLHQEENPITDYKEKDKVLKTTFNGIDTYVNFKEGKFITDPITYNNNEYLVELDRGQGFIEPTFSFGFIETTIDAGESFFIRCSTNNDENFDAEQLKQKELSRLKSLQDDKLKSTFANDLIVSANQFLVSRKTSKSIIAGYPWFTDWGRDTMIAMRGYTLPLKQWDTFKAIIRTFFGHLNKGILPNRFPDNEEPEYNTVDGTLWACVAILEYFLETKDKAFIKEILSDYEDIINWHIKGTHYNIHVNELGFVEAGSTETQLTWMDAKIGDYVSTPRNGCPVEITALFYNALKGLELFKQELNASLDKTHQGLIKKIKTNFPKYFVNENGYLNDVYSENNIDDSIRPNQLIALSIPFSLVNKKTEKSIIETCQKHLLTDYGLRTLSPKDANFRPNYEGDQWSRDTAYHQGTTWPFLLGFFFEAYLKTNKTKKAAKQVEQWITPLKEHFYKKNCINGISEVFDGLNPKEGKGCFNQAWSVTALLGTIVRNNLFED